MDAVERDVYLYLTGRGRVGIAAREISRHVGGPRRFRRDPDWIRPVLQRMTEREILERDAADHYCIKAVPKEVTRGKVWASPGIAKLLEQANREFSRLMTLDDVEAYYDRL
jgi:hypothetical protein